jgi:AraC family transcriptional regulator
MTSDRAVRLAQLAESALAGEEAVSGLELTGIGYELLTLVGRERSRAMPPCPHWLTRVRERLLSDVAETPALADLASAEGVAPDQLARAFRRHFGQSVAGFLRSARIDRAMRLLAETDKPVLDVALEAGFYDQSHLTNRLKRQVGMTPAAYRRRFRQRRALVGPW